MYVDGAEMSAEKSASRLNDVALYCPSSLFFSTFLPRIANGALGRNWSRGNSVGPCAA